MTEETLFALALEKSNGAERQAFLDAACGGDRRLRDRVEQLLAADERSRGILEQGPGAAALLAVCDQDTPVPGQPPDATPFGEVSRIITEVDPPGYELSERVGEGGMGVVYRARDTRLDRDVAVKLLHSRFAADGPAARRFLGEARVTAQLQHPGVPPVHEVGALADGRPFLVMKLIKGRTLADLLADEQADRGRLLADFEKVCQAVAYAHAHKVIHRDLKPSNVMVGPFGEVQVMDWGLAKVLGSADCGMGNEDEQTSGSDSSIPHSAIRTPHFQETRTGSVLGTPANMPPEQAIGAVNQIDERSDVFGLGAILCAVLTGKPPYVAADFESTRQLAARGKLDDAFARLDGCGADPGLVELCKRCLAPEKIDRLADARAVARTVADLRAAAEERARVAELDRVRAEGDRAKAEAEAREQRKRRRVQAGLGLTLTAAVALVGFGLWWNERQESKAAADRASRQSRTASSVSVALDDARARIEEAWALADEPYKMRVATDLALAAVRRAEGFADAGEPTPDTLTELAAVRAAADDLDRHTRLFVIFDLAAFGPTTPEGYPQKGTPDQLEEAFKQCGWDPVGTPTEEIAAKVVASRVRNKILGFFCAWEYRVRSTYHSNIKVGEVVRVVRLRSGGLLAVWQRIKDAGNPSQLAEFAAMPEVLTLGPELLCVLARELAWVGQRDARLALCRRAVDRYPTNVWLNSDWMSACEAVIPPRRAEALRAAAVVADARPNNAVLLWNLGECFRHLRDDHQAIACYRKAIALSPRYLFAHKILGEVLIRVGDREGVLTAYREWVRHMPEWAVAHYKLGGALRDQRELDEAIAAFLEAVRLEPILHHAHHELARLLAAGPDRVRDGKQAIEYATQACELTAWNDPWYIDTLAAAYAEAGDFEKAAEFQKLALSFPDLKPADGKRMEERLRLYEQRKPYRDPALAPREVAPPPRELKR